MQFPVSIELHRSFLLTILLVLLHAIAAACLFFLPWTWILRLVLLILVGVSAWYALRPPRIIGLCLSGRDRLNCLLADGNRVGLTVLADSTVFSRLIVLRLRIGEESRVSQLALLPDQMSAEKFRILRLWLRWHATPKGHADSVF